MDVLQSLLVSSYVRILKHNKKEPERITYLKKEFIDYIEGNTKDNLSNELTEFLSVLLEEQKQKVKGR